MRFKFSLETLFHHRRHLEDAAVERLAQAQRRLAEEEATLQRLRALEAWGEQELSSVQTGRRSGWELSATQEYLARIREEIRHAGDRICECGAQFETVRTELLERRKGRRVVEILRDRDQREYQREVERGEERRMDEAASNQFIRREGRAGDQ
jgi:flagellar export protein FliJ